ncbi:tumor D54-like isoform X4 [Brachionus plicatilis]|uniref:Tumor D54-like isoform X4 n=1 Tax=Brachionus plicatilis TaxID=10195 RepID=A0A3M7SAZ9_BRAPC|nr:tumor D54-like isoform X4 [Brachionus plicatilis]
MSNIQNGKDTQINQLSDDTSIEAVLCDEGIEIGNAILQQTNEDQLEKEKLMTEYREELAKIQEDIGTLRLVLNDKIKRENELKTLLGISFVDEIKHDLNEGFTTIKSSVAYQKTAQTLSDLTSTLVSNEAYQKTSAGFKSATQKITPAFQTLGGTMKSSLGSLRNASLFKSFETGIGSTFNGSKLKNSHSEFIADANSPSEGIPTSKTTNGIAKEAIMEDNN